MDQIAHGTFTVALTPRAAELDGRAARLEFDKTFCGDVDATSRGLMLSVGDPSSGRAGYVAIEIVTGCVGRREGTFAFQQFGAMTPDGTTMHYAVVPGSGAGELTGLRGELELTIDGDGTHHYSFAHRFEQ